MSVNNIENLNDLLYILDSSLNKENGLIEHHLDSINKFYSSGIEQIMTKIFNVKLEINNQNIKTEEDKKIEKYELMINFKNISLNKPTTDNYNIQKKEILYPVEANKKDLTYASALYTDVEITAKAYLKNKKVEIKTDLVENFKLAEIPVMVKSVLCNTYNNSKDALINLNEDPDDMGGYFIIKSNEWIIDNIESTINNKTREFVNVGHKNELCRSDIISKPGDGFENSYHIVTKLLNDYGIIFQITNKRINDVAIPFYVMFRALGVCTDKEIIEHITYSFNENDQKVKIMLNILEKSFEAKYKDMDDMKLVYDNTEVLELLGKMINRRFVAKENQDDIKKYNIQSIQNILDNDVLPHVGLAPEDRYKKVRFLGHIINRLLNVHIDKKKQTDRDSYINKRILPAGVSYSKVFKTHFNTVIIQELLNKYRIEFKKNSFSKINLSHIFTSSIHGDYFKRALTQAIIVGDDTIVIHKKQATNRLSSQQLHRKNQLNVISSLRNINTPSKSDVKQSERANEMRRVHPSSIGYICCVQSADTGADVGTKKQMAISTKICLASSSELLKNIILNDDELIKLDLQLTNSQIYNENLTKVFVNGDWIGCCRDFKKFAEKYRNKRRNKEIHYQTSVVTDIQFNELYLWVDTGRVTRPLLIVYNNLEEKKDNKDFKFKQYIKLTQDHINGLKKNTINLQYLFDNQIVEYISADEQINTLIAKDLIVFKENAENELLQYTHLDIPQSILGIPALTSPFSNHNQAARVVFQTNQVKQTCGVPCLNWAQKYYKDLYVQIHNEIPLCKTIANKYIRPMGMNCVVAIMTYGGFNQEDSIIVNKSAIDRGLFTIYNFTIEKTELEKNEKITKPNSANTLDIKAFSNYEKLVDGIAPVGSYIEFNDVIIGKVAKLNKNDVEGEFEYIDRSIIYKHQEPAYVFYVEEGHNEDSNKFCKVVLSRKRKPELGCKFCLDNTHEILTKNDGWKYIDKMKLEDEIMVIDDDNKMSYEKPERIHKFWHEGEMLEINDKSYSICSTMEHKHYINNNKKSFELMESKDLINIKNNDFLISNSVINTNNDIKYFHLKKIDMDLWLMFFGIFISNGIITTKNYPRIFTKNKKIINNLIKFSISTNIEITETKCNQINYYTIKDKKIGNYLKQFKSGSKRFFPEFIWDLSKRQCRILLNSIMTKNNSKYYTKSYQLSNDISRLIIHCGYSSYNTVLCKKNDELKKHLIKYKITCLKDNKTSKVSKNSFEIIEKKCAVYCPSVRTGKFFCRRNGIVYTCGNSSRSGQKGIVGATYNESDLPFTKDGIKPDIIFSPFSLPSRMTIGVNFEGMASKICANKGSLMDTTIFKYFNIDDISNNLKNLGFNHNGTERLFNGMTGKFIDCEIFIGPIYYQCLQKFTVDTLYYHKTAPTDAITRQPLNGKSSLGGLKVGEMETAVLGTNSVNFLREKFIDHSDKFTIFICKRCGKRATVNEQYNIYKCNYCENLSEIVKVPSTWSAMILQQEIESANVGMKFITK